MRTTWSENFRFCHFAVSTQPNEKKGSVLWSIDLWVLSIFWSVIPRFRLYVRILYGVWHIAGIRFVLIFRTTTSGSLSKKVFHHCQTIRLCAVHRLAVHTHTLHADRSLAVGFYPRPFTQCTQFARWLERDENRNKSPICTTTRPIRFSFSWIVHNCRKRKICQALSSYPPHFHCGNMRCAWAKQRSELDNSISYLCLLFALTTGTYILLSWASKTKHTRYAQSHTKICTWEMANAKYTTCTDGRAIDWLFIHSV